MRIFRLMEGDAVLDEEEVEAVEDLPTPTSNEQVWVEVPFTSPPQPVLPRQVTPRQIRKAIRLFGIYDQVEDFKETLSAEILEEWEFAEAVDRNDPLIAMAAVELELSPEQVDSLFILASTV